MQGGILLLVLLLGVGLFILRIVFNTVLSTNQFNSKKSYERYLRFHKALEDAGNRLISDENEDIPLLYRMKLFETRSENGDDLLKVIDGRGDLMVNKTGLHYLGVHRRMTWEWSKIMQVSRMKVSLGVENVSIIVSNRQKVSGVQMSGTREMSSIMCNFITDMKQLMSKSRVSSSKQKGKSENVNNVYNIVQNFHDSVVQENINLPKEK